MPPSSDVETLSSSLPTSLTSLPTGLGDQRIRRAPLDPLPHFELEARGVAVAVQDEDGEEGCAVVRSQARPCLTLARMRVLALPWRCGVVDGVVQVPATARKGRQGTLAAGACGLGI